MWDFHLLRSVWLISLSSKVQVKFFIACAQVTILLDACQLCWLILVGAERRASRASRSLAFTSKMRMAQHMAQTEHRLSPLNSIPNSMKAGKFVGLFYEDTC